MTFLPVHLSKLFRPLEPKVLRAWLVTECPALDDDALWAGKTRKVIKDRALPALFDHLDQPACRKLDVIAERVRLVADRAGQEAWTYLHDTLVEQLGTARVEAIEAGGNAYYRALTLYLEAPRLFAQVEAVRYADEWRGGRLYSGFQVPQDRHPGYETTLKEDFEAALDALFQANREIVSEHFAQRREQDDGSDRTLFHFHVVHKGLEDDYETLEDKEIVSKPIFPANHLRMVYLPDEGLLEVYAHQRNLRPVIARLFVIHVLGESGELEVTPERRYTLERLREATPLPIAPEDALRSEAIDVMEVRFAAGSQGSDVTLKRGGKDPRTVYQLAAAQFGEGDPFKGIHPITRARLVIRLRKTGPTEPARKLPIVVTLPNKCNIRHRGDGDQKLGDKYVRLWGLIVEEEPLDAIPDGLADAPAAA